MCRGRLDQLFHVRPSSSLRRKDRDMVVTSSRTLKGHVMAAPPQKPHLGAEQRRALEVLDLSQRGCSRPVWAAHGLTLSLLVNLVRDGLADVQVETLTAHGWTTEVVRIRITAAGRRALEG